MEEHAYKPPFPLIYSRAVETFLTVCQYRSFTKAAEILDQSQSSISHNIMRLEQSLGVPLFDRTVRPIMLTSEAVMLRQQLESQFSELTTIIERIRDRNSLKPIVKIGVIDSLLANIAPELIRRLSPFSQQIALFSGGVSSFIVEDLLERKVDLIISNDAFDNIQGLSRYFIFREPYVLILPKNLAHSKKTWGWQDLLKSGLPFVRYSGRSTIGRNIETYLNRLRLSVPHWVEADASSIMFTMVNEGLGWALTTPLCLTQYPDLMSTLHIHPMPQPHFTREIYIAVRQNENPTLVRAALKICREQLEQVVVPQVLSFAPWINKELFIANNLDSNSV